MPVPGFWVVMPSAAKRQLQREALDEWHVPGKARVHLARVTIEVDGAADVQARSEDDIGKAVRIGDRRAAEQEFYVDILALFVGMGLAPDIMLKVTKPKFAEQR